MASTVDSHSVFSADLEEDTASRAASKWGHQALQPLAKKPLAARWLLDTSSSELHQLAARNDPKGLKDALEGQAPECTWMDLLMLMLLLLLIFSYHGSWSIARDEHRCTLLRAPGQYSQQGCSLVRIIIIKEIH